MIASLLFPTLLTTVINGNASSDTTIRTRVTGDDARVKTSITTTVNGETITVTTNSPGSINVMRNDTSNEIVIDGQPITPTITRTEDQKDNNYYSSNSAYEADNTIGKSRLTPFRNYAKDFINRTAAAVRQYFKNILDKLYTDMFNRK